MRDLICSKLVWVPILVTAGCREVKPKIGQDGEDVEAPDGSGELRLRMPARFEPASVKGAAWTVLTHVGPAGMSINEIARQIQQQNLRDLRTSKTPEVGPAII